MNDRARTERPETPIGPTGERARTRILDTAEALFAQAGPAAVTLRSIAAAANANAAAVNYYFGSKEKLFEEMFLRRIVPLNEERLAGLAACMASAGGHPALEAIVAAFALPALRLMDEANLSARAIVVQYSLGRVLALPEVNQMLTRYYARVREAFVAALQQALPQMAPHEVVWRYYWMGGSLMVALAVPPEIGDAPADGGEHMPPPGQGTMETSLIAFLAHGLRAPGGAPEPRDRLPGAADTGVESPGILPPGGH